MCGQAPWLAGSSCTQTKSSRVRVSASAGPELVDGRRVELLDPHQRGVGVRRARRAAQQVVEDLAGAEHDPLDASPGRARPGRRAPAAAARGELRRSADAGLAAAATSGSRPPAAVRFGERLAPQQVEVAAPGSRDATVMLSSRAQLQEALEPAGPVVGALALVAVREQQRHAERWPHLASPEAMNSSTIVCAPSAKSPNCASHTPARPGDRVAVLEAHRGVLAEQRVVDVERGRAVARCASGG